MNRSNHVIYPLLFTTFIINLLFSACSSGDSGKPNRDPSQWKITLDIDGEEVILPLKVMDVYLVEDENYPESYYIKGNGVSLLGNFPDGVHVGYGEKWDKLFDEIIQISEEGVDPYNTRASQISLPGNPDLLITDGYIVFSKLTGKYSGSSGDLTIHGTISLTVDSSGGEQTYEGTISVQCVSWG
ncbi:MAG TPA: hypothetical protein VLB82_01730 [Thermodesulfobacteriota bacterium]|nr:hypothetical protein [Thermodesulfobacteriota bacterium]